MGSILYASPDFEKHSKRGGTVRQTGNILQILHRKVNPFNPATTTQQYNRQIIAYLSKVWVLLSSSNKSSWETVSFGSSSYFNAFLAVNYLNVKLSLPVIQNGSNCYKLVCLMSFSISNTHSNVELTVVQSLAADLIAKWGDASLDLYSSDSEPLLSHSYNPPGLYSCQITTSNSVTVSQIIFSLPNVLTSLSSINPNIIFLLANDQLLSSEAVNNILINLDDNNQSFGAVNLSGQLPAAPPTGAGLIALSALEAKGWSVATD